MSRNRNRKPVVDEVEVVVVDETTEDLQVEAPTKVYEFVEDGQTDRLIEVEFETPTDEEFEAINVEALAEVGSSVEFVKPDLLVETFVEEGLVFQNFVEIKPVEPVIAKPRPLYNGITSTEYLWLKKQGHTPADYVKTNAGLAIKVEFERGSLDSLTNEILLDRITTLLADAANDVENSEEGRRSASISLVWWTNVSEKAKVRMYNAVRKSVV